MILRICLLAIFAYLVNGQDPTVTITRTDPDTLGDKTIVAIRDKDVTMSCYVENLPARNGVRWQKTYVNNEGIVQTQKVSEDTAMEDNTKFSIEKPTDYTWRLRIKAVQVSDEGNYTCFVQTTRENKKFDNRTLVVTVPPYLNPDRTSPDTTLREGDNIDLMCNASGRPSPTIEWTRIGGAVLPTGELSYHGSVMKIRNVQAKHRGVYVCNVFNSVGQISRDIQLEVKFKPIIKSEGANEEIVYQAVGYRTELQCIAEANPIPAESQLAWRKDGTSFSNSIGRYEVKTIQGAFGRLTYELIIHGVEKSDYGTYSCHIRNSEGESSFTVKLKETETPQASIKLGRIITGAESSKMSTGDGSRTVISMATALMCLVTALLQCL